MCNHDGLIENFYVAIPASKTLDLTATEPTQKALIQAHASEVNDLENVSLILALVDASTTIAYYKLNLGINILPIIKNTRG